MSASFAASAVRPAGALAARLRVSRWEHPDWWLWILAGGAWVALAVRGPQHGVAAHDHHMGAGTPAVDEGSILAALVWWTVMVLAMMLPLSAGHARWLAHRSLARRRTRTVLLHTLGYVGVWLLVGAALVPIGQAIGAPVPVTVAALLAAAAWHVTPSRRRRLRRCGAGVAPAVRGWPADLDCLQAGLRTGRRCAVTCGPAMVAMIEMHTC